MKTEWEDLFGVYDCEDDDSLMVKKRIQVRLTHVFNGCETTSYVDLSERHLDDFLAENDAKLVPENATTVDPEEYARMKDLARMYADQVERANREAARANYAEFLLGLALDEGLKTATTTSEGIKAAKIEGYDACEKVYREREEAWEAERAELVENLRVTQNALSELRRSVGGGVVRHAMLIKQCIDDGHDLEITEVFADSGGRMFKVRVDPATRTVHQAAVFDAIEEMLKEVRRG